MLTKITHQRSRAVKAVVVLLVAACCLVASGRGGSVLAQEAADGGITVAPSRATLEIAKGATSGSVPVSVRNNYDQTVSFETAVWGVKQLHDGSLSPSDDPGATINDALSVIPHSFALEPGQSINAQITVQDSSRLSPGGQYAAIIIKQIDSAGRNLSLSPAVSVITFIIKEDGAVRKLSTSSITESGSLFRLPDRVTASFINEGNLSVVPRASVQVRGPNGAIVKTGVLNQESLWAPPSNTLKVQADLIVLTRAWIPGRYSTHVFYRYDGSDDTREVVVSRWIVPPIALLATVILLGLIAVFGRLLHLLIRRRRRKNVKAIMLPTKKNKSIDGIL